MPEPSNVVALRPSYRSKLFKASWEGEEIHVSGTLCGHIDFAIPGLGTLPLTPGEAEGIARALLAARDDVLANSRPFDDPMLVGDRPHA